MPIGAIPAEKEPGPGSPGPGTPCKGAGGGPRLRLSRSGEVVATTSTRRAGRWSQPLPHTAPDSPDEVLIDPVDETSTCAQAVSRRRRARQRRYREHHQGIEGAGYHAPAGLSNRERPQTGPAAGPFTVLAPSPLAGGLGVLSSLVAGMPRACPGVAHAGC